MQSKKEIEKQQKEEAERSYLELNSFELGRVTPVKGGIVFFDAVINGLSVHGMKVVPKKDQSGDFIAWPSTKGADGKYYSVVFAWLRPETEKSMLKAIQEKLDAE